MQKISTTNEVPAPKSKLTPAGKVWLKVGFDEYAAHLTQLLFTEKALAYLFQLEDPVADLAANKKYALPALDRKIALFTQCLAMRASVEKCIESQRYCSILRRKPAPPAPVVPARRATPAPDYSDETATNYGSGGRSTAWTSGRNWADDDQDAIAPITPLVNINGLPMCNGVDIEGNPYGVTSSHDYSYSEPDYSYSQPDYGSYASGCDYSSGGCSSGGFGNEW